MNLTDSVLGNAEALREAIRGATPEQKARARAAAQVIETAWNYVREKAPKDPAAAAGAAFAIFCIAEQILERSQSAEASSSGLILPP